MLLVSFGALILDGNGMCLIQKQLNVFCFVSRCCCRFKGRIWALIGHLDHCFTISKGETKAAVLLPCDFSSGYFHHGSKKHCICTSKFAVVAKHYCFFFYMLFCNTLSHDNLP